MSHAGPYAEVKSKSSRIFSSLDVSPVSATARAATPAACQAGRLRGAGPRRARSEQSSRRARARTSTFILRSCLGGVRGAGCLAGRSGDTLSVEALWQARPSSHAGATERASRRQRDRVSSSATRGWADASPARRRVQLRAPMAATAGLLRAAASPCGARRTRGRAQLRYPHPRICAAYLSSGARRRRSASKPACERTRANCSGRR